jgi:uncharacterized protein
MLKLKTLLKALSAVVLAYLILCFSIYAMQKYLLFPAYVTKPVAADWQPQGQESEQALIKGNCGELNAAIWRRPNAKGTIMMFHGNGESLASIDDYAYAFHDLGYNLMAWDYPGYGQSSNCWFSQEMLLADAENAYQWLASKENPKKIYIFGYSIGTGIALAVASHHQQNPVYLVAAYDALLKVAIEKMPHFVPVNFLLRYPMKTNQWLDAIQQPIYLIHGKQDALIRPERAQSLVKNANGKAKIEWVDNAGHADDTLFAYRNRWLKRLLP